MWLVLSWLFNKDIDKYKYKDKDKGKYTSLRQEEEGEEVFGDFLIIQIFFRNQRFVGAIVIIHPSIIHFPETTIIKVTNIFIIINSTNNNKIRYNQGKKSSKSSLPPSSSSTFSSPTKTQWWSSGEARGKGEQNHTSRVMETEANKVSSFIHHQIGIIIIIIIEFSPTQCPSGCSESLQQYKIINAIQGNLRNALRAHPETTFFTEATMSQKTL